MTSDPFLDEPWPDDRKAGCMSMIGGAILAFLVIAVWAAVSLS